MPAFAQSPCRSARDSVFSIGDSPELAGLRIRSFIDHRWGTNCGNGAWHPEPSFLWPTVEERCGSSTDDEGDFWRSERHGALHRYTPSTSSVGTSVLFGREDAETDDLEYELPSLGTARLQSHRSMPIGRLVYVSKSPTQPTKRNDHGWEGVQSSLTHSSRRSDWSRTLSALFEHTWNEHHHEQLAGAPLRRQTVHACQTSISEIPSFDFANGHPVLSPSESSPKPERDEWEEARGAPARQDSQADVQWPLVDLRQTRFGQALRSHPTVPTRISSFPRHEGFAKGELVEDDETVMGSEDDSATDDGPERESSPSASTVLEKFSQQPSTPKKTSAIYDTATQGDHSPSRARSLSLFPNSPAQTLVDDTISVHALKASNSSKFGMEADTMMLKSRLRKWWERYCRRNKR